MRPYREISCYRINHPLYGPPSSDGGGAFFMRGMIIVASWDEGWDHVSVSRPDRFPTWEEMERVKRAFFRPDEVAFQLHVPVSDHISVHPFCLHIWRPHAADIPLPPKWMVG